MGKSKDKGISSHSFLKAILQLQSVVKQFVYSVKGFKVIDCRHI